MKDLLFLFRKSKSSHKNNYQGSSQEGSILYRLRPFLKIKFLILVVLLVVVVSSNVFSMYYGMYLYKHGKANSLRLFFQNLIKTKLDILPNMINGLLSKPERISIDIKYEHFQKLAFQRKNALDNRFLSRTPDDFVPAKIHYKDKNILAKVRLKGDLTDHLTGQKWSFRVKIKDKNTLFGMKRFSIQHPKTRNFLYEWIYLSALKREGVISPRYKFINVTINGKNRGIYALEEHFGKRLLENNMRREGPIIKLNEDVKWFNIKNFKPTYRLEEDSFYSAEINPFQKKKTIKNKTKFLQYLKALQLFELFRRGELTTSEVFDTKTLARYFAIVDLLSAHHSAEWSNLRFYYNPVTSKLEPIGFNAFGSDFIKELNSLSVNKNSPFYNTFHSLVFKDLDFVAEYTKTLERISEQSYVDNLLSDLKENLLNNLTILNKEFPYYNYSDKVLYDNQKFIRLALNPLKGLQAFFNNSERSSVTLELGNTTLLPIEVVSVSYQHLLFYPAKQTILPPKIQSEPIEFLYTTFFFPEDMDYHEEATKNLVVNYNILGTEKKRQEAVHVWSTSTKGFIKNDIVRQSPTIDKFNFLLKDEMTKNIYINPGKWTLSQNLIIPKGYTVICMEGTSLNLTNGAKIISYSALEFNGTEENPIFIYSDDSKGQGIAIIDSDKKSVLNHTVFKNLKAPSHNGWELTGAVTFYESDVAIKNCQFLGLKAEDSLNIVRSQVTIDNSLFKNAFSDSIDIDFGKGEIRDSYFINTGDDAIDTSGSKVHFENIFIDGTGDKGISAGENSEINGSDLHVKNAVIAVASKDLSKVTINRATITNCNTGLSVYQKKEEFGPGNINIKKLVITNTDIPYMVKDKSNLLVNNKQIEETRDN